MRIQSLLALSLSMLAVSTSAQRSTEKNVKINGWRYPAIEIIQPTSYQVFIHNGSIPIETSSLIKKKTLTSRLQKSQDELNGRIMDYYTYYNFTSVTTHPDLLVEVSFGNYTEGQTVLKEHKIPCTVKGQKLSKDNIFECPAYYYERRYSLPYIISIANKAGEVLHIESFAGEGEQTFGYVSSGLSGYLRKAELDSAFAAQQRNQPMKMASQALVTQLDQIEPTLQSLCFYSPLTRKIPIASAKGKSFDYSALDLAQKQAIDVFDKLKRNDLYGSISAKLEMPVDTWKREVSGLNMIDDDARINRSIATGLYTNIAFAYLYGWQLDSAEIYLTKAQNLAKYATWSNAMEDIAMLATDLTARRSQWKLYQALSKNKTEPLPAPALMDAIRVKSKDLPYMAITGKNRYQELSTTPIVKKEDAIFAQAFDSAIVQMIASVGGSVTPLSSYEQRVQRTGFQGYILLLTALDGKFETIPEEVCKISYLNELTLTNNALTSVPESISQLTELKRLNLSNNKLTSLPSSLQQCKKLKVLNIKGNAIPAAEIEALKLALLIVRLKLNAQPVCYSPELTCSFHVNL